MTNSAVLNAGIDYINGMQVSWVDATTLLVTAGHCRNSTNINDIFLDEDTEIDATINGAGGLDQGDLANNTFYYVYAIGSSVKQAAGSVILSTAPVDFTAYPAHYDMFRLIARGIKTDGSAEILQFKRTGAGNLRKHMYDVPPSELAAGNATTFTDVDVASSVPVGGVNIYLQCNMTPATADNALFLRVNGSPATNGQAQLYGSVATKISSDNMQIMVDEDSVFEYKVSNGSDAATILVQGFDDPL